MIDSRKMLDNLCLAIVFLWFFSGGIGHFVRTDFFAAIVPPYIPDARLTVLVSGVFELLGALGLLYLPTRKYAAWGLFVLTICVTPANVYMWQNPQLFPKVSPALLGIRLVLQIVLLACIARCANAKWRSNAAA